MDDLNMKDDSEPDVSATAASVAAPTVAAVATSVAVPLNARKKSAK